MQNVVFLKSPTLKSFRRKAGFSLVEVTLALGIISFGLLSVLGLMPVGLTTLRQATEQFVETQIVQKVSGQILLTPYSQVVAKYNTILFYFNQEGDEVPEPQKFYTLRTVVKSPNYPGSLKATTATPGSSGTLANSLQVVEITLTGPTGSRFVTNVYVPSSGN